MAPPEKLDFLVYCRMKFEYLDGRLLPGRAAGVKHLLPIHLLELRANLLGETPDNVKRIAFAKQ